MKHLLYNVLNCILISLDKKAAKHASDEILEEQNKIKLNRKKI